MRTAPWRRRPPIKPKKPAGLSWRASYAVTTRGRSWRRSAIANEDTSRRLTKMQPARVNRRGSTKSFSEHVENVLKQTRPIVAPYKYGASKGRAARYCLPGHHYWHLILLCGQEYFRCDSLFKIQSSVFCVLQSISSTNWPRFRSSEKQYNRRKPPSAAAASAGRQQSLKTEKHRPVKAGEAC